MFQDNLPRRITTIAILFLCVSVVSSERIYAQTNEDLKKQVMVLVDQNNFAATLPLLEKILAAEPNNARMHFYLGFALLSHADIAKDERSRKPFRMRARQAFVKAKDLGIDEPVVDGLIHSIPEDGADGRVFSQHAEANALMFLGEQQFGQGKLDEALKHYQRALQLDPRVYFAALFSGDVFMHRGDFAQAEIWYQRAIAIDPTKEIAYRYSATPLMKQGKTAEALDRYIAAFIAEPYSKFARAGLTNWAHITQTSLAHPEINIPVSVSFDEKGNWNINLDASALSGKDDGSFAWLSYGAVRASWRKEKFAREFPGEKTYRHSLAEEADALRNVVSTAVGSKEVKTLNPSLAQLKKLNDEGLLEAYILLARPDEGIARDHPAYLKANRDKLRRYVKEYVVTGGGRQL